jgi:phage/plasmid-associated DNA primase
MSSLLSQIIPNQDDLQYILYTIAYAVTTLESCDFLYLCGSGSNGKSTLVKILKACLSPTYYIRVPWKYIY